MHIKKVLAVPAVAAGILLVPGVASADTVGTPGEPSCFGERMSHAASDHRWTPKERAARFEVETLPFVPEAQALFGDSIEVREIQWFVRVNCSDNPIVP